jgi:hypothetical protein
MMHLSPNSLYSEEVSEIGSKTLKKRCGHACFGSVIEKHRSILVQRFRKVSKIGFLFLNRQEKRLL